MLILIQCGWSESYKAIINNFLSGLGPKGGGSVGDHLLSVEVQDNKQSSPLQAIKHMVYAGIFPADQSQHVFLSDAIKKLALNDSAVSVNVDSRYTLFILWGVNLVQHLLEFVALTAEL